MSVLAWCGFRLVVSPCAHQCMNVRVKPVANTHERSECWFFNGTVPTTHFLQIFRTSCFVWISGIIVSDIQKTIFEVCSPLEEVRLAFLIAIYSIACNLPFLSTVRSGPKHSNLNISKNAFQYRGGIFRDCPLHSSNRRTSHAWPFERRQRQNEFCHTFFMCGILPNTIGDTPSLSAAMISTRFRKIAHPHLNNKYIVSRPPTHAHRTTHYPIMGLSAFRATISSWMNKAERSSLQHIFVPIGTIVCHVVTNKPARISKCEELNKLIPLYTALLSPHK